MAVYESDICVPCWPKSWPRVRIYFFYPLVRDFLTDLLTNRSGLVGKYMNGHAFIAATIELNRETYPGMNPEYALISRQFFRCPQRQIPYVRHDLRIWANPSRRKPRLKNEDEKILFGDEVAADWRARAKRRTAWVRAYYDPISVSAGLRGVRRQG